jgi:uncharacterized membrane protein YcaP (DUF421 family)
MPEMFEITVHPLELIARGSVMYVGLVLAMRFLLRRDAGSMSMADLLFIVLIADASQNAMAGEYRSLTDGVVLVATLIAWNIALDWLAYHSKLFRWLIEAPSLPLIKDGRWIRRNLKKEWITTEEVQAKLREHGVDDIAKVRLACLESNGELTVVQADGERSK